MTTAAAPGASTAPSGGAGSVVQTILLTLFTEWLTHLFTNPASVRGANHTQTVTKILTAFPFQSAKRILEDPAQRSGLTEAVRQAAEIASATFPGIKNLLLKKAQEVVDALAKPNAPTDSTGWNALVKQVMDTTTTADPTPAASVPITNPQDYVLAVTVTVPGSGERRVAFPLALDAAQKPVMGSDGYLISHHRTFMSLVAGRNPTCVPVSLSEADRLQLEPCDASTEGEIQAVLRRLQPAPAPAAQPTVPDARIDQLRVVMAGYCAKLGQSGGLGDVLATVFGDYLEELKNVREALVREFITRWSGNGLNLTQGTITDECAHALIRLIRSDGAGNLTFTNSAKHSIAMFYMGMRASLLSWPILGLTFFVLMGLISMGLGVATWLQMFWTFQRDFTITMKQFFVAELLVLGPVTLPLLLRETGVAAFNRITAIFGAQPMTWNGLVRGFWHLVCWILLIGSLPAVIQALIEFMQHGPPTDTSQLAAMLSLIVGDAVLCFYLFRKEGDVGLKWAATFLIGVAGLMGAAFLFKMHLASWWDSFHLFASEDTLNSSPIPSGNGGTEIIRTGNRGWWTMEGIANGVLLVVVAIGLGGFAYLTKKLHLDSLAKILSVGAGGTVLVAVGLMLYTVIGPVWESENRPGQLVQKATPPSSTAPSSGGGTQGGVEEKTRAYKPDPKNPGQNAICGWNPKHPSCK